VFERRTVIVGAAAAALAGPATAAKGATMYGLIGKMLAQPGKRSELIALMLEGSDAMPGCFSYVVAEDAADPNAIWITEVWDSADSHMGSLKLDSVQATIAKARPLIAGFGERFETKPVGGVGLGK